MDNMDTSLNKIPGMEDCSIREDSSVNLGNGRTTKHTKVVDMCFLAKVEFFWGGRSVSTRCISSSNMLDG